MLPLIPDNARAIRRCNTGNLATVSNPAFDVTPARYIAAVVTKCGVAYPPVEKGLKELMTAEES